ncbi:MAG: CD225/dispanin family protein [Okeania sp. SIO2C9]|uniref:CD225/dispanin family protein n=1 Tax=Okeania sp. SIO2C9 TaxID=2607791 RepID=UPI0013C05CF8|nr:CD225/dispanin family protein [Okeania sp. SIO2C9]NEQ72155.1 CD225/dispanin family protein [Okeania sp. SIO2C9]
MTPSKEHVPNYLTQAILVTLFCCLPFGIVAIVYAAQVNSRLELADLEGAIQASNNAKKWCWFGFIGGAIILILYVILAIIASTP